ncbi:MAG: hypothetical protein IIU08_03260, partial [Clostridia bacterium]|nr:hypothetical protein [Clostridia bacterium]
MQENVKESPLFNARLNLRRKAAGLVLRMFQLHQHRPRGVDVMFRLVHSAICKSARGSLRVSASRPRDLSIVAQRAERSHQKIKIPAPH